MNDDADLQPTPSRKYPYDDQRVSDAGRVDRQRVGVRPHLSATS